jgi:transcription elongation factor GreA
MADEILLTPEGYDKVVNEHDELVAVKRQEIAERIKEAISYGDISENAEYDSAKNEQAELEERILKLEYMLRMAKIIDDKHISDEVVNVGLIVTVKEMNPKDKATKGEQEYIIVGSTEADPFEGKISNESPIGKALLGKKTGDIVEVNVPNGLIKVKVVDIRKQEESKDAKETKESRKKANSTKRVTSGTKTN